MLQNTQFGMSGPTAPTNLSGSDFEILTTAPRSVLAVTPHPDDCEGGCGGAIAKWVREHGTDAVVVMCTNGNKGTQERDLTPERLAAIREQEQLAAADGDRRQSTWCSCVTPTADLKIPCYFEARWSGRFAATGPTSSSV